MTPRAISFRISRCKNTTDDPTRCLPDSEIDKFISDLNIQFWSLESAIDMNKYHNESYTKSISLNNQIVISAQKDDIVPLTQIFIKHVKYHTKDGYFGEEAHNHDDDFLHVEDVLYSPVVRHEYNKDVLMENRMYLAPIEKHISRSTYNMNDLISQLGGTLNVIKLVLSITILPLQGHLFILTMIKRLYFARTLNPLVFGKPDRKKVGPFKNCKLRYVDNSKIPPDLKKNGFEDYTIDNYFIHLSTLEKFLILPHIYIPGLNRISCWKKRYEMTRLYERGKRKLEQDMNIFRVINRLNYIMMLTKQTG